MWGYYQKKGRTRALFFVSLYRLFFRLKLYRFHPEDGPRDHRSEEINSIIPGRNLITLSLSVSREGLFPADGHNAPEQVNRFSFLLIECFSGRIAYGEFLHTARRKDKHSAERE